MPFHSCQYHPDVDYDVRRARVGGTQKWLCRDCRADLMEWVAITALR